MKGILSDNIQAAVIMADIFSTAYGPRGMNKLLVDNLGETSVTKVGGSIIDSMEIKHPVAKLIAETGKTMNEEIGDGVKNTIILTGELLSEANKLISQGLHPMMIANGYSKALINALRILDEKSKKKVDEKTIKNLIKTALQKDELIELVNQSVKETEIDDIIILKKAGKTSETQLVNGLVIDKERVHSGMPAKAINAKILVTKNPIEIKTTMTNSELEINNSSQLKSFLEQENRLIKEIVNSIIDSEANVVLCQKGISDQAQEYLAKKGIIAIRRVREKDIDLIIKATKANLVNDLKQVKSSDLGTGSVYTHKVGDEKLTFIDNCPGKVKTIIITGATEQVADELEKKVNNALGVIKTIRAEGSYVPGAGVIELMISNELKKKMPSTKERISYEAFAEALKKPAEALIKNAGMKTIDLMPKIDAKKGVNQEGEIIDPLIEGIIEPTRLKRQSIISATETAVMILRINEVLKGR